MSVSRCWVASYRRCPFDISHMFVQPEHINGWPVFPRNAVQLCCNPFCRSDTLVSDKRTIRSEKSLKRWNTYKSPTITPKHIHKSDPLPPFMVQPTSSRFTRHSDPNSGPAQSLPRLGSPSAKADVQPQSSETSPNLAFAPQ